jgi:hypothetical protein
LDRLINLGLIANPYNWIVVFLMVAIASAAWTLIDPLKIQQAQGSPV